MKKTPKNKRTKNQDRKSEKKKENKLYVRWKGYDCSFNSCIDKNNVE